MSSPIISVEGLSKSYTISHQAGSSGKAGGYRRLSEELLSYPRQLFSRFSSLATSNSSSEEFWALKDVSFEVTQGEVVGIIGRNGAGKSTLLKVLSRITEPTSGRVTLRGRVASLLEVGTGFHPELTGRENIFLNGAILGMSRAEIRMKFDEIVQFAEVERFLDTPVKRYSSGMYVRLAFAVAAYLEPEILVVDEVLAVGDVQFQKKCLGKMVEVARGGRTVLFVSHNMAAISTLTARSIMLEHGSISFDGATADAIRCYTESGNSKSDQSRDLGRGVHTRIREARLLNAAGEEIANYMPGEPLRLEVIFETDGSSRLSIEALLIGENRSKLAFASLHQFSGITLPTLAGCYRTILELAPIWPASGGYFFDITTSVVNSNWDHYVDELIRFDVTYSNPGGESWDLKQSLGYGSFALPTVSGAVFAVEEVGNSGSKTRVPQFPKDS